MPIDAEWETLVNYLGDYYNLDAAYFYLSNSVSYGVGSKKNGMSVLCLKD